MSIIPNTQAAPWRGYQQAAFRFFFIYFLLQAIPLDWKYYVHLFSINWLNLRFSDIFYISRYTPQFVSGSYASGNWGIGTLTDWAAIAAAALAGAVIWTFCNSRRKDYHVLYYWLRVILRYRLAIGIIAYGFIKFFPLQAPYPSLSNLNTAYGDFNRWKLFSLSLGIVPGYEAFLGAVEIATGLLLLFRKTATFGALVILVFTGNVFISNLAYNGGEAIYSLYLISIALFLLVYDAQRIYSLVALRKPTAANQLKPVFIRQRQRAIRLALKSVFIFFFVLLYGYKTYAAYHHDVYQYPKSKGLPKLAGLYNVRTFRINNKVIAYSLTDSARWQDVVFEKWATISVRSFRAIDPDTTNTEEINADDQQRKYELEGTTGRSYYSYVADTAKKVLVLRNKNSHYAGEQFKLYYSQPDSTKIILSGINEKRDTIYAELDKINKKYLLKEAAKGRNKGLKL